MHVNRVKSISDPLYYYRDNKSSVTKVENKNRYSYHIKTFAYIRYLCDLNDNKEYLKGFRKTWMRSSLSLWFDKYVSRHVLTKVDIRKEKPLLKAIKGKDRLDISINNFDKFIEELYKPL